MNAYIHAMKHSFDFKGRATRSQFWIFTLVSIILGMIATGIDLSMGDTSTELGPIALIVVLIHFVPSLSITVRRLHDINRSGWWILIGLVPAIGLIVLLVFLCTGSKAEKTSFDTNSDDAKTTITPHLNRNRTNNSLDEIEKIASLRSSGALSEDEFQKLKADILTRDPKSTAVSR